MKHWLLTSGLRDVARRLGITRLLQWPRRRLDQRRLRGYRRNPVSRQEVALGEVTVTARIGGEDDYLRTLSLIDDQRLIEALGERVGEGGVFWDVGSNIGLWACAVSKLNDGRCAVVAFEPEPRSADRAEENARLNDLEHIEVMRIAVGGEEGTARLNVDADAASGTHSLIGDGGEGIDVPVRTGDALVAEGLAAQPSAVKIDVEGFEEEVIDGMAESLASPRCRAVLCEVHFSILARAGKGDAARRIAHKLERAGLTEQRWLDPSHLLATRPD